MSEGVWDLYRDGITQGLVAGWLDCREKTYLAFRMGLGKPYVSAPLFYGSLVHGVLEKVYMGDSRSITRLVKETAEEVQPRQGFANNFQDQIAIAHVMLQEYFKFWKKDDKKIKWLLTEQKFDVPYKMPSGAQTRLRGMIDGVFHLHGKLWLLETKTASRVNDTLLMDRLPFDIQVNYYLMVAEMLVERPLAGVLYNILRKPQLRQGAKEPDEVFQQRIYNDVAVRPDWYFLRYEIRITKKEQLKWRQEFEDVMKEFEEWYHGHGHYRNPVSCDGKFGSCGFLPICSRRDHSGFTRREHIFPELEG